MYKPPKMEHNKMTKWNWMPQYPEKIKIGDFVDIGAFSLLCGKNGIEIQDSVEIGSHSAIYSANTIKGVFGKVTLKQGCSLGSHCTVMPGVTIGEYAMVGAYSFVKCSIPSGELWCGIPAKFVRKLDVEWDYYKDTRWKDDLHK